MRCTVMETVVRLLPVFVSGFLCNLVVGFNIPLGWLPGALFFHLQKFLYSFDISHRGRYYRNNYFLPPLRHHRPVNDILGLRFHVHHERGIFAAGFNTMTHVHFLHYPNNFTMTRVYDATAR